MRDRFDMRPHYVYEFYADDGACLYVGSTWQIGQRLGEHYYTKSWWLQVKRIEVTAHSDHVTARQAERERIELLDPPYNKWPLRLIDPKQRDYCEPCQEERKAGNQLAENDSRLWGSCYHNEDAASNPYSKA